MDHYQTPGTKKDPKFDFDSGTGKLTISGNCLCEFPETYFEPALNWLEIHLPAFPDPVEMEIYLTMINPNCLMQVVKITKIMERLVMQGKNLQVKWFYNKQNDEFKEFGEMLNEMTKINITVMAK